MSAMEPWSVFHCRYHLLGPIAGVINLACHAPFSEPAPAAPIASITQPLAVEHVEVAGSPMKPTQPLTLVQILTPNRPGAGWAAGVDKLRTSYIHIRMSTCTCVYIHIAT